MCWQEAINGTKHTRGNEQAGDGKMKLKDFWLGFLAGLTIILLITVIAEHKSKEEWKGLAKAYEVKGQMILDELEECKNERTADKVIIQSRCDFEYCYPYWELSTCE